MFSWDEPIEINLTSYFLVYVVGIINGGVFTFGLAFLTNLSTLNHTQLGTTLMFCGVILMIAVFFTLVYAKEKFKSP
jgi:hypothetical protein